jgi:hypothetical protein
MGSFGEVRTGARRAMAERGRVTCCCVAMDATEHAGRSLGACFSRSARLDEEEVLSNCANHHNHTPAKGHWLAVRNT